MNFSYYKSYNWNALELTVPINPKYDLNQVFMKNAWSRDIPDLLHEFQIDPEQGLDSAHLQTYWDKYGQNSIALKKKKSSLFVLLRQFKSPVIYILLLATLIAFLLKEYLDGWAILSIVLINAIIGFIQESKAEASIEALAALTSPLARVLRNGKVTQVNSQSVFPGEILILEAGDYVVADTRILLDRQLSADESILTGESLSVVKKSETIQDGLPLGERTNMLFAGTAVSAGTAKGLVVATGINTEIGKIAQMMNKTEVGTSPLQVRLEGVSKLLLWIGLLVIILIVVIGYFRDQPWLEILMTALSLSIAAIPEGLPTVVTIALVMAVRRMSKKKALVRKMNSVETLGATDIICTDKTGTLTTGKMKVRETFLKDNNKMDDFNRSLVLCNNASLENGGTGDTTEVALLDYAQQNIPDLGAIKVKFLRIYEWSFDSSRKMMSVAVSSSEGNIIYTKGAPESVIAKCKLTTEDAQMILYQVNLYSKKGMRVLAIAHKRWTTPILTSIPPSEIEIENELEFLGLVSMADPPREESMPAIKKCQAAGIRVIMITGDHPQTALAIAYELGIVQSADAQVLTGVELDKMDEKSLLENCRNVSIYARVSPENKLKLVNSLKSLGHIVAMTGDGVNDAPALKTASIGISMGKGGTEVARQASSMILTDDNFATIVDAVEEGRAVNGNIKRTIQYLLSTNLAELLFILTASLIGWPIPLHPINILWLNLVTDGLPSLALAAERVPSDYLENSSRPTANSFFDRDFFQEMISVGVFMTGMSLAVYYYGMKIYDVDTSRSMAFCFLVYIILFRAFSSRSERKTHFEMKPNYYLLASVLIPILLQLGMQKFDFTLRVFQIVPLSLEMNFKLLLLAAVPVTLIELRKIFLRRGREKTSPS